MARATSRVRLGAACQNPFTQHPYEIAGGLAVLDTVSSGRAYLGLARGAWLDAIGLAPLRPLAGLRDAAAIVRALLSGDDRGYTGAVYRLAPGVRLRGGARRGDRGGQGRRGRATAGADRGGQVPGGGGGPRRDRFTASGAGGTRQGTGRGRFRRGGGCADSGLGARSVRVLRDARACGGAGAAGARRRGGPGRLRRPARADRRRRRGTAGT